MSNCKEMMLNKDHNQILLNHQHRSLHKQQSQPLKFFKNDKYIFKYFRMLYLQVIYLIKL